MELPGNIPPAAAATNVVCVVFYSCQPKQMLIYSNIYLNSAVYSLWIHVCVRVCLLFCFLLFSWDLNRPFPRLHVTGNLLVSYIVLILMQLTLITASAPTLCSTLRLACRLYSAALADRQRKGRCLFWVLFPVHCSYVWGSRWQHIHSVFLLVLLQVMSVCLFS